MKVGVREADGTPLEFVAITVSDAIAMGHEGMKTSLITREVIADSVELVAIDMQKDFTSRGGFADNLGLDMRPMEALARRVIALLDDARAHGVFIVHVMANYDLEHMSDPMHERLYRHGQKPYCLTGTEGTLSGSGGWEKTRACCPLRAPFFPTPPTTEGSRGPFACGIRTGRITRRFGASIWWMRTRRRK